MDNLFIISAFLVGVSVGLLTSNLMNLNTMNETHEIVIKQRELIQSCTDKLIFCWDSK